MHRIRRRPSLAGIAWSADGDSGSPLRERWRGPMVPLERMVFDSLAQRSIEGIGCTRCSILALTGPLAEETFL